MKNALKLLFLVLLLGQVFNSYGSPIVPDSFSIDPSTPHCLAFRWFVVGDSNKNATCSLDYRESGAVAWKKALPMLRIIDDTCNRTASPTKVTGNLFAGSVLNLKPGTEYDVRFNMHDPDGGDFQQSATQSTNKYPAFYVDNEVHVYPPGFSGTKMNPNYSSIAAAVNAVSAGTVILVHGGTYTTTTTISKAATASKPIVIRGAGDGPAIIDLVGYGIRFTSSAKHIYIENLVMRNCQYGVFCSGTEGIVVRNCEMTDVRHGIFSRSTAARDCFFMNNRIIGKVDWYPRNSSTGESYGIVAYGTNMVICYNTIARFWDCIETTGNYVEGGPMVPRNPLAICVDIYNNDLTEGNDDLLEIDYGYHNIRVWQNRLWNAHVGISAQPFYGGPGYIFRNVVFNCTYTCLKFHNQPSGLEVYHNSFVNGFFSFPADLAVMQNTHLRNNAFLGYESGFGVNVEVGTRGGRCTFDYNGYDRAHNISPFFFAHRDYAGTRVAFVSIDDLRNIMGWEENGFYMQNTDFIRVFQAPSPGTEYSIDTIDARIASQTATPVDKGMVLPIISDGFAGSAPDIGAIEYGDSLPHYGVYTTEVDLEEDTLSFTGSSVRDFGGFIAVGNIDPQISSFDALHKYITNAGTDFLGIEIYSVAGEQVRTFGPNDISVEQYKHLPNGMYFVVLSTSRNENPTCLRIQKMK